MPAVCSACFGDEGIKTFIEANAAKKACTFCGARARKPLAATLEDVVEFMRECIAGNYGDPAEWLPYDSAEGGYQGVTFDTYDLVNEELGLDFPNDQDGSLSQAVQNGLGDSIWCETDPFGLSPGDRLAFSWEEFCRIITHERRHFFLNVGRSDGELHSPRKILNLIFSYAEDAGLIRTLPQDTRLFRARREPRGTTFDTVRDLGPPPVEAALQSNRMSPPGVVMTYVADTPKIAIRETASKPGRYKIAEFATERQGLILDLSKLQKVPSLFCEIPDYLEYDPRPRLEFLHRIRHEISRPIARDNRIHVEYVPTQVVTEYLRFATTSDGARLDGIRYRSSRLATGTALVLFADQDNMIMPPDERPSLYHLSKDRWIRLVRVFPKRVRSTDLRRWSTRF
jgi:hypothetical protein